jgi:stearoyl-CoA desaturase (Delta-9 desaturase)
MHILSSWTLAGGVLQFSGWGLVFWTLFVTHLTILMVTIYLHRAVAHRALRLHGAVEHLFRAWNWLTTGMRVKEWAAIHRKHHAKVDTENDPHTPVTYGFTSWTRVLWWIVWVGVRKYVAESKVKETLERYGEMTPDDWVERNLYTPYNFLGVLIFLPLLNLYLFGLPGIVIWGVQAIWIPVLAAGVINGVGHALGYQNFKKSKEYPNVGESKNIMPWGILIGGEELHNNHHADPLSPFLAHKWWEIDTGGMAIRLLCLLKLATLRPRWPKGEM